MWAMEDQTNSKTLLSSAYDEEQDLLNQPFLLPEEEVLNYEFQGNQSYEIYTNEAASSYQPIHNSWENCTASLEEVESAVFSSSQSCQMIEIQRLDTKSEVLSFNIEEQEVTSSDSSTKKIKRSKKKTAYKHVPHCEKPAHIVEKRNARERRRVEAVNAAFLKLRRAVPLDNKRGKRVSKVKILQRAIDYILNMKEAIDQHDGVQTPLVYDDRDDDHLFAF